MLLEQYEEIRKKIEPEKQYNHTLLINCFLGIIVLPKEKHLSYIPCDRITSKLREEFGIEKSKIGQHVKNLKDLIIQLRHSVAHFNLNCISLPEGSKTIDAIQFIDAKSNEIIIEFVSNELLPFVKKIAEKIIENINTHKS